MIVGIGIDIVDVAEFRDRLDHALIDELFLPAEADYARSQARLEENFAARFAAKEAAFKALGAGLSQGLRWRDVEVVRDASGAVGLELHGAARALADEKNITGCRVSLSHTRSQATALVVMEKSGG
ncbi:holo-ACP synthase [bacterium]|nr:holo-ACP synthase [bacterium]